jgi:hypothetical protein
MARQSLPPIRVALPSVSISLSRRRVQNLRDCQTLALFNFIHFYRNFPSVRMTLRESYDRTPPFSSNRRIHSGYLVCLPKKSISMVREFFCQLRVNSFWYVKEPGV